jgi:hypothetical protein
MTFYRFYEKVNIEYSFIDNNTLTRAPFEFINRHCEILPNDQSQRLLCKVGTNFGISAKSFIDKLF